MNRVRSGLAVSLWLFVAAAGVTSVIWAFAGPTVEVMSANPVGVAAFVLNGLAFATAGAVIALRRPGNVIGWVFLGAGLLFSTIGLIEGYAELGLLQDRDVPGALATAWVASWLFDTGIFAILGWVFLLFPDGRLPSPRWRWHARYLGIALSVHALYRAFRPGPLLHQFAGFDNPLEVSFLGPMTALGDLTFIAVLLGCLASVASLVVRFRRSQGVERLQLKWITAAGLLLGLIFPAGPLFWTSDLPDWVWTAVVATGLACIPLAAVRAIMRYKLYEIDRVISRALAWATLTAALVGLYLLGVLGLSQVLRPVGGASDLAVAGSTLVVAAAFQPLRRRIQDLVDRRFNRARYDAQRTVEAFTARLRDEVDLDELSEELAAVVHRTVMPATASIWVREAAR